MSSNSYCRNWNCGSHFWCPIYIFEVNLIKAGQGGNSQKKCGTRGRLLRPLKEHISETKRYELSTTCRAKLKVTACL